MTLVVSKNPWINNIPNDLGKSGGRDIHPVISNNVAPSPDNKISLPPRTNLTGFPSAFQDSINGSGGPPIIISKNSTSKIGMPTPRYLMFYDWCVRNSTQIIMIGIGLFVVMSVSR